jgi:hypothetical protein
MNVIWVVLMPEAPLFGLEVLVGAGGVGGLEGSGVVALCFSRP